MVQKSLHLKRGTQLGKYRLKKRLGTGGMCEVWEARDSVEGIWVALKIPLQDTHGQRDNNALLKEVKAVSRLRHPNILTVKNADIIDGYALLATEISTNTLADCSSPMSFRRICSIIVDVLEALAHAHRNKIVHCDVTPNNIFLFQDGRAALGDFGISVHLKGRKKTIDDYGTPGYVAPEQAYGYPTYSSDCFSLGLILYEYITGVLPRWPFNWPFKGQKRLREKTSPDFIKFMKKALSIDPGLRFTDADKMLKAMLKAIPSHCHSKLRIVEKKRDNWRKVRQEAFNKRYAKIFPVTFRCIECDELIDERMKCCPWCGSEKNRFDFTTQFSHICHRCHKGISSEWKFCPWCYGAGFEPEEDISKFKIVHSSRCEYCNGKHMRFMTYCPWCHRKVRHHWNTHRFPETCQQCKWPVDSEFWNYCPWCKQNLFY
jgi:serine/threonine-protein kinase